MSLGQALPGGELLTCPHCGQAKCWDRMGLEGQFAHLIAAASASPDAMETTPESNDRGRAKGLQAIVIFPNGKVSVIFHHKARGFDSLASAARFFR